MISATPTCEEPVILCRRRVNRIVRPDVGNARNFACAYHGWAFSNNGKLEYVPGQDAAYYGALDRQRLGLVEARVDTYAGIVFATWDRSAPSLNDFVGDARWLLDINFNRLDNGAAAGQP